MEDPQFESLREEEENLRNIDELRDLGIDEEENCDFKAEENVEMKHDGLDNEGFGNEGWVDSYMGINILCERFGGSVRQIPFDNPLLCGRLRWLLLYWGFFLGAALVA